MPFPIFAYYIKTYYLNRGIIFMNILLKNIDIITADRDNKFIKKGNIGIEGGIIKFIDSTGLIPHSFLPDRIIDGKHKLVMPGLVNAHTHCAMTILRNFADDLALEEWLFKKVFPAEAKLNPDDVYWGTMLGIAEMIKSGTTAFADMYLYMQPVACAVTESGIRANLSISPLKFNVGEKSITVDEAEKCIEFHKSRNNSANGRIKVSIEVHSAYLFNKESLIKAAQLAKQLDTGIQIHLLETPWELEESVKRYGMNSAEICLECGIFDVPVIAAHCIYLSDSDMDILKAKGVTVAHNPTSNLKLGSGIARVPFMLGYGINVALGTDGTASNNNLNMFEEMHLAALLHKGVGRNPELVNAGEAIRMGTANGAKALGFEGVTGCIKEGLRADIIILDTDKPHFYPMNDHISAIVYSAQGSDVDTVIIDGNIVMENRQLVNIDEELIKARVEEISKKILT
jgi:5-methylthioadenosine/S-adenosylhomocysteine deaminase